MYARIILSTALLLVPDVAIAQNSYQYYGTTLGRIKGYGALETDNYRGTTTIHKRSPAATWFSHRVNRQRFDSRSRPSRRSYNCYGRDCNGD